MTVTRETYLQESFEVPTEEQWGLSPDEQMMLFGDSGIMDKYGDDAISTLTLKTKLAREYLSFFWPTRDIPRKWRNIRDAEEQARDEMVSHLREQHPSLDREPSPKFPSTIAFAIWHDYDTEGWFTHLPNFKGASVRAIEFAIAGAQSAKDTSAAVERVEYVVRLLDEENAYGRRGDMRCGGSGAWVELPAAPWRNRLEQFPMRMVDEEKLF